MEGNKTVGRESGRGHGRDWMLTVARWAWLKREEPGRSRLGADRDGACTELYGLTEDLWEGKESGWGKDRRRLEAVVEGVGAGGGGGKTELIARQMGDRPAAWGTVGLRRSWVEGQD